MKIKPNYQIIKELQDHYLELKNEMLTHGWGSIDDFVGTPIFNEYIKLGKILGSRQP